MKTVQRRRIIHTAQDRAINTLKNTAYSALQAWWRALYAELRRISKADILNNGDEFWDEQERIFNSRMDNAIIEAAKEVDVALRQVYLPAGLQYVTRPWPVMLESYKSQVAANIGRGRNPISDYTREATRNIITEWYAEGRRSLDDVVTQLAPYYDSVSRAQLIAQTEVTAITAELTAEMMKQDGDEEWIWETANDMDVCEECRLKHGKLFKLTDDMPPLHPRCRCDMGIAAYAFGKREPVAWEQ